jgi:hypothetical protein
MTFRIAGGLLALVAAFYMCVAVITALDRHDAIIALGLFLLALFAFDHADESASEFAPREGRFTHQYQHIEGLTVVG